VYLCSPRSEAKLGPQLVSLLFSDMPSKENLFGLGGGQSEEESPAVSAVLTDASNAKDDTTMLSNANGKTNAPKEGDPDSKFLLPGDASDEGDESIDSRYIPDIDDFYDDHDEAEDQHSLILIQEVKTIPDVIANPTNDSVISAKHLHTLTKFSTVCMTVGIEVLKLNRRRKWQTRFLTVSSETLRLQLAGEIFEYPKALLWLKRFQPSQSQSLEATSEGRGGVEFAKIQDVTLGNSKSKPPKSFSKFRESVQLDLQYEGEGTSRSVALRFKTQTDANFFATSIAAVTDLLYHEGIL
jgi:hypothetical protein